MAIAVKTVTLHEHNIRHADTCRHAGSFYKETPHALCPTPYSYLQSLNLIASPFFRNIFEEGQQVFLEVPSLASNSFSYNLMF